MKDQEKSLIPQFIMEDFSSVTMILYHLQEENLHFESEYLKRILKDFSFYGLGINVRIRKEAYKALEWIVEHPEVDYQSLDSWHIRDNKVYFKKMQMLFESMKVFRLYENIDRSEMVKDVPFVRDFVSVQNVPLDIKINFYLVTNMIYEIEMRDLRFDREAVDYYLNNGNHFLERPDHRKDLMTVLNWISNNPKENYKAIAPWYILNNDQYVERTMILSQGIIDYLKD